MHAVDHFAIQVLAGLSESLNVAIVQQIVLQAERLFHHFVEDRKDFVPVGNALLNEVNARVVRGLLLLGRLLVEVVVDVALLEALVVVEFVFDLLRRRLQVAVVGWHDTTY